MENPRKREPGSRKIAVVDDEDAVDEGEAYVVLLVGPPPAKAESRRAKED